MSVDIDPSELSFQRPFTVEVARVLKITNPNSAPVAFKVKTTAPKQYCVRPNSGRIEPGHDVEVSVLLQAMKQEPPLDQRCRDKFLVQSVAITSDKEFTNVSQIWDSVDRSAVQERKIRVNWLSADASGHVEPASTPMRNSIASANGVDATPDPPPAYSSPSEDNQASEVDVKPNMTEPESAPSTVVGTAVSATKAAAENTSDALKEQLAQAKATIASLKSDLSSGLRQRKATTTEDTTAAAPGQDLAQTTRQGTEGVPLQVVALLCLVSFLLAYFFF